MSKGLPYYPGSPLIDGGGQAFNILAYGGKGNDSFLNDNALAEMYGEATDAGGGECLFPPGTYLFSSPLVLDRLALLHSKGVGCNQFGSGMPATLLYTSSGSASAISCHDSRGIEFERIKLSWSNAGFTGYLLDYGPINPGDSTANGALTKCSLWPSSDTIAGGPAALLFVGSTYGFTADRCMFRGGNYNILNRAVSTDFNNGNSFRDCTYSYATTAAVKGGQNTRYSGGIAEPLSSGAAGFFLFDATLPSNSITIEDMWMGDDHAGVVGAWITWGAGKLLTVRGGQIDCEQSTTGILINANGAQTLDIRTYFFGFGGSSKGVDFGSTTGHSGFVFNSPCNNVTTPINGTIPSGSIVNVGGTLTLYSPVISGSPTITGTITANEVTVSGATTQPNALAAAQANFETGTTTGWGNNLNATLTNTTAAALVGTHSLSIANNNNSGTVLEISINSLTGLVACSPGQTWTALASFRMPSGSTGRLLTLVISAVDSSHLNFTTLGTSTAAFRDNSSSWQQHVLTGVSVPATINGGAVPAFLYLTIRWTDTATNYIPLNEVHYLDCVSLSQSSSTEWQDPAATSANVVITSTTIQRTDTGGDLSVLASGTNKVDVNYGPGAGSGGVNTGGPSGSFTTVDGHTVTITNGVITGFV